MFMGLGVVAGLRVAIIKLHSLPWPLRTIMRPVPASPD
jgi:hypothetical protein